MTDAMNPKDVEVRASETLRSLDHRVRNNYAALFSLVDLARAGTTNVAEFAATMTGHIRAMATAHELLSHSGFRTLVLGELAAALARANMLGSLSLTGPAVQVASRQSVALSLVLQQLFSTAPRRAGLLLEWMWADEQNRQLRLTFTVSGSACIELTPTIRGLLEGLIRSELRGHAEFDGHTTLVIALDEVSAHSPGM